MRSVLRAVGRGSFKLKVNLQGQNKLMAALGAALKLKTMALNAKTLTCYAHSELLKCFLKVNTRFRCLYNTPVEVHNSSSVKANVQRQYSKLFNSISMQILKYNFNHFPFIINLKQKVIIM